MSKTDMGSYIHLSKYSRWRPLENRRETWEETVSRLVDFWVGKGMPEDIAASIREGILTLQVMPSMRSLMTAGPALDRDNVAGFNCAAIAVSNIRVFDEIFYLLMCGCGVGFSVERQYVNQLPQLPDEYHSTDTIIKVSDSKIGWAKGLRELLALLYQGLVPSWDLSLVRPEGALLKTFGGRASGPEPLDKLLRYVVHTFKKAKGGRLTSIECHDLICKIADTVIVGSVRRSACISLSNLTDDRMRRAKMGEWYLSDPHRALSNNSVAYTEKPDLISYLQEMESLYVSKAGERGIVNKEALKAKAQSRGREHKGDYLLNPCGEAILRDTGGLCNLSEVIIRSEDTLESVCEKVRLATILGTYQATLCDFRYLRPVWKNNQKEERLLGVSLTGIMDHAVLGDHRHPELTHWLSAMKLVALETNEKFSSILGIPASGHVTLVKPSGTVSQLCNTSSGIHPRFSPYYLRRVTQDSKDPLTTLMVAEGIPYVQKGSKFIFSFPVASPANAVCTRDIEALDQLELWSIYEKHWCDGNPSQTIYYSDSTFISVVDWVYRNWDSVGGLSFFPFDDYVYDKDAQPYLEISQEEYEKALSTWPTSIQWERLPEFEKENNTSLETELACSGGQCEI